MWVEGNEGGRAVFDSEDENDDRTRRNGPAFEKNRDVPNHLADSPLKNLRFRHVRVE